MIKAVTFDLDGAYFPNGAKKLGIKTFLYEGFDNFLEHLKSLGVKI